VADPLIHESTGFSSENILENGTARQVAAQDPQSKSRTPWRPSLDTLIAQVSINTMINPRRISDVRSTGLSTTLSRTRSFQKIVGHAVTGMK
jgi:hypothetical protein